MEIKEALKLAIAAIEAEMRRLAVNANLFKIYNLESCRPALERREKYLQAKRILLDQLAEKESI